MKRIIPIVIAAFFVMSLAAVAVSAEEPAVPKTVKAVYGTPTVDGEIDIIWDSADIYPVPTLAGQVYQDDEITTPSTMRFRVLYDDTYLYILVEVHDETMADKAWEEKSLGGNLWRRDGVSFTFAPNGDTAETAGQVAPAFWFIIGAYGNTANWNRAPLDVFITEEQGLELDDAGDWEKIPMEKRMYAISYQKDTAGSLTGYTIETKINLNPRLVAEGFETIKMEPGRKIGFDIYLNDNNYLLVSATRNYGLCFESINSYKNNAEKAVIELQDQRYAADNSNIPPFYVKEVETLLEETTAEVTTAETPADTTAASVPDDTTAAAPVDTTAEAAPQDDTSAPAPDVTTAAQSDDKGCSSAVSAFAAVIAAAGAAFAYRRRRR